MPVQDRVTTLSNTMLTLMPPGCLPLKKQVFLEGNPRRGRESIDLEMYHLNDKDEWVKIHNGFAVAYEDIPLLVSMLLDFVITRQLEQKAGKEADV